MEMELELSEIWRIIRRHILLIIILIISAVTISGFISFFVQKPVYEATATLLVQNQKPTNQIQYNDLMTNQQLVKTYEEIIKSRLIAQDVIKTLNLNLTDDQLLSKVQLKSNTGSLVTSITVTDRDPRVAVNIANGFADSFSKNINSIMKVDNVTILDQAKLAEHPTPVSPKPYLNMAIAFVLGIMVGVGIAFLLEFLDKTVKTEEEIDRLLGLPVLGVITIIEADKKSGKQAQAEGERSVAGGIEGSAGQINMPL